MNKLKIYEKMFQGELEWVHGLDFAIDDVLEGFSLPKFGENMMII